jgi:hypothetical protein
MDHRVREDEKKEIAKIEKKARKQAEFLMKPPLVRFFIQVGNVAETIFLAITGFVAWLLFWLGG